MFLYMCYSAIYILDVILLSGIEVTYLLKFLILNIKFHLLVVNETCTKTLNISKML